MGNRQRRRFGQLHGTVLPFADLTGIEFTAMPQTTASNAKYCIYCAACRPFQHPCRPVPVIDAASCGRDHPQRILRGVWRLLRVADAGPGLQL